MDGMKNTALTPTAAADHAAVAGSATMGDASQVQQPIPPVASGPESLEIPDKKGHGGLIQTIVLVVVSIIAAAAVVFGVYYYLEWEEAQTNIDGKIAVAEAVAREEQQVADEEKFAEREKEPNLEFLGPSDYGSLSFMYPRTWSMYVEKDAATGGDFTAYLNPRQVNPISQQSINALRVNILNRSIETERVMYDGLVTAGQLTHSVFQIGNILCDKYKGTFDGTINGIMIMFKVNDKTVTIRTDAMIFEGDFNKLVQTIRLN